MWKICDIFFSSFWKVFLREMKIKLLIEKIESNFLGDSILLFPLKQLKSYQSYWFLNI